jgi:hypothetical protein
LSNGYDPQNTFLSHTRTSDKTREGGQANVELIRMGQENQDKEIDWGGDIDSVIIEID